MVEHARTLPVASILAGLALAATAAIVAGCSAASPSPAATPSDAGPAAPLSVVAPNSDPSAAANLFLAQELGYFDDENVQVDLILGAGATGASLLVSGQADLLLAPTTVGLPLVAQGEDLSVIFSDVGGGLGAAIAVPAGSTVKTRDDLAGLKVGVNGTTGLGFGFGNFLSEQIVADGGEPIELVTFGDATTMLNALTSGGVDAVSATTGNFAQLLASDDVRLVVDTTDPEVRDDLLGSQYTIDTAYEGLPDTLESKRESVVRFLAALTRANGYLLAHSPEQVADVLAKSSSFQELGSDSIALSLAARYPFYTPSEGRISEADWDASLAWFSKWNIPALGSLSTEPAYSYDAIVDMSFLDEAQERVGASDE